MKKGNRKKLSLTFYFSAIVFLIVLTFVVVAAVQFVSLDRLGGRIEIFIEQTKQRESIYGEMLHRLGYGGLVHYFKDYILTRDPALKELARSAYFGFIEATDKYRKLASVTDQEIDLVKTITGVLDLYYIDLDVARKLMEDGKSIEDIEKTVTINDTPAIDALNKLIGLNSEYKTGELAAIQNSIASSIRMLIIIVAVCALFLVVNVLMLLAAMNRRFRVLASATGRIEQGDLRDETSIESKDAVGMIAANFRTAVGRLRETVGSIKSSVESSESTSGRLTTDIDEAVTSVDQITSSIGSISGQIENLDNQISESSSAIEEILATIESLSGQIENQTSAVTEMSASIQEMTASIGSVSQIAKKKEESTRRLENISKEGEERLEETNALIRDVHSRIDTVLEMIRVIDEVTSKTNLLSMNAAIEAAHAGDAGRGFAVVADEIRKLSESTAENARGISEALQDLIEKIGQVARTSTERAKDFTELRKEVSEVVSAFSEILKSMEELAIGSREIMEASTSLMNFSNEITIGSREMQIGAKEIRGTLSSVKQVSAATHSGIEEIHGGAVNIRNAISHIVELNGRNAAQLQQLMRAVEIFRTED